MIGDRVGAVGTDVNSFVTSWTIKRGASESEQKIEGEEKQKGKMNNEEGGGEVVNELETSTLRVDGGTNEDKNGAAGRIIL